MFISSEILATKKFKKTHKNYFILLASIQSSLTKSALTRWEQQHHWYEGLLHSYKPACSEGILVSISK